MTFIKHHFVCIALLAFLSACQFGFPSTAQAQLRLRDVCRIKGQEENTLHGLGIVVGLKGTGDGDARPTTRALAQMLNLMGNPIAKDLKGQEALAELKDAKNVALVFVTATVPAAGAAEGTRLDCQVNAISAKSLEGGRLMLTRMLGPHPSDPTTYGLAEGRMHVDDPAKPAAARVHEGCKLEAPVRTQFVEDGKVTLVLDRNHADFHLANEIAELINSDPGLKFAGGGGSEEIAKARDQAHIEVRMSPRYSDNPVLFVSMIENLRMQPWEHQGRVVINERSGGVVIGSNVEIGPVAVTHKSFTIEAGPFFPLDPGSKDSTTKLKSLVDALNAIKAPPQEIIEIIKLVNRQGSLYGKLIIE
jgi:flagellar P-ring protein precursor FlgI